MQFGKLEVVVLPVGEGATPHTDMLRWYLMALMALGSAQQLAAACAAEELKGEFVRAFRQLQEARGPRDVPQPLAPHGRQLMTQGLNALGRMPRYVN